LQRGDEATHDRILLEALPALAAQVELVLLAQASMARLSPSLPDLGVPVLTSPALAVQRLRSALNRARHETATESDGAYTADAGRLGRGGWVGTPSGAGGTTGVKIGERGLGRSTQPASGDNLGEDLGARAGSAHPARQRGQLG